VINTSASSSRVSSPLRKLFVTATLIGLAIVLLDQVIEYIFDNVLHSAPSFINEATFAHHSNIGIDQFWKLLDAGITPIVFSGSSTLLTALSPHTFDEQVAVRSNSAVTSVNISLVGSRPLLSSVLSKNVIFPEHPSIFFYGIELRALNDDTDDSIRLASPLGYSLAQESALSRTLLLLLLRRSGFIRYRNFIQGWLATGQLPGYSPTTDDPGFISLTGMLKGREYEYATQRWPFPKASSLQHEALKQMAIECRQQQVPCIFIGMPMSAESYKHILPQDSENYREELKLIVKDTQIPIWNFDTPECRDLFDSTLFMDTVHLNNNGASVFSSMMATLYVERIEQHPTDNNAGTSCVEVLTP
jgi:hypothetical protein